MIKITAIGGHYEIGRNCTAIEVDDEVVILDMGIHLEHYINYTNDEDLRFAPSGEDLIKHDAIPNVNIIKDLWKKTKAIIVTHAHLDHIGAIPFLGDRFPNAGIYGSPYSIELLSAILKDEKINIGNKLIPKPVNSTFRISKNITIEFISVTHSTPQAVMVIVKTKYGDILYANDFKFDDTPTLGEKPNYEALKRIGASNNLKVLITNSLYADDPTHTPSESIAKEMVREVLLENDSKGKTVLITTFSSHIARLNSIISIGKRLNRKIILMGRSLTKYVHAAENVGLVNFSKDCRLITYGSQIKRFFEKESHPERYLFIVTGHQGEPQAVLGKLVNRNWLRFMPGDNVIFSSSVIPVENSIINREKLEKELLKYKVKIFKDVHVSGHAGRKDLKDLVLMVNPKYIIPIHGDEKKSLAMKELSIQLGYKEERIKILRNGNKFEIN
jgi:ribonuclease J